MMGVNRGAASGMLWFVTGKALRRKPADKPPAEPGLWWYVVRNRIEAAGNKLWAERVGSPWDEALVKKVHKLTNHEPERVPVGSMMLSGVGPPRASTARISSRTGLVAYYRLDNSLSDSSGNGRDLTGSPAYGSPGKLGSNHLASGTNTLTGLSVPYTGLTVSCWVQFDNTGAVAQGAIFFTAPAGIFGFRPLNQFRQVQVRLGATTVLTSPVVTASAWHHFAVTCDSSGNITLYVDGAVTGTASGGPTPDSFSALTVGASVSRILVDEAAFHSRDLTAAEVAALYNSGTGFDPTA